VQDGTIELVAKKDIQEGEALCISYTNASMVSHHGIGADVSIVLSCCGM
jgi:hypothetical protein